MRVPARVFAPSPAGESRAPTPPRVSERAKERGHGQLGTMGSGNHFVEVQRVDRILDARAADAFGLAVGAPASSPEGASYLAAMAAAANFARATARASRTPSAARSDSSGARGSRRLRRRPQRRQDRGIRRTQPARAPEGRDARLPGRLRRDPCRIPPRRATRLHPRQHGNGEQGIVVRCPSPRGLAEEAPLAYKDVERVVSVVERAGLAVRGPGSCRSASSRADVGPKREAAGRPAASRVASREATWG
jgi:tRNA-splicing ligase RtcB